MAQFCNVKIIMYFNNKKTALAKLIICLQYT